MHNVEEIKKDGASSMNESVLDKYLLKMAKLLTNKPIIPIEHQLWDEKDIAQYFKYSEDYTKKHIIKNHHFPPSRQLPTSVNGERTVPRWKATDVIKFAMAFDKASIHY
ncbi:hypothetical protein [Acinetobacter sp. TGL-Y2]|uniref:hypothetical protein n=1 Tax=Acinetobacter sp. TGL-Y2 TaxID=1407071 RepID=UPI000A623EF8